MSCKECQHKKEFYSRFEDGLAYDEEAYDGYVVRRFSSDIPEHLLKWHWDPEDRKIQVIGQTDWKFQFDNELPIEMDSDIYIEAGQYHRIIKGNGDLKLKIYK